MSIIKRTEEMLINDSLSWYTWLVKPTFYHYEYLSKSHCKVNNDNLKYNQIKFGKFVKNT